MRPEGERRPTPELVVPGLPAIARGAIGLVQDGRGPSMRSAWAWWVDMPSVHGGPHQWPGWPGRTKEPRDGPFVPGNSAERWGRPFRSG